MFKDNLYLVGKWMTILTTALAGEWVKVPYTVQILIMLMGLDILSGVIAAIGTKSLNSSIMAKGLFKKFAVFPLLALLHIIEKPLALPFEFESLAALAYIVYEAMSIVENCANAGVPIPAVIVSTLAKAKIRTATPQEVRREFAEENQSTMSISKSTEIIKTADSSPDLKVNKTVTVVEEKHITPMPPTQDK